MEARLTKQGALELKRAGKWRGQTCAYKRAFCGDICPLFQEAFLNDRSWATLLCADHVDYELDEDLREWIACEIQGDEKAPA